MRKPGCFEFLAGVLLVVSASSMAATAKSSLLPLPELPRVYVDTTWVAPEGKTLIVRANGDFQAALDKADPGDVIMLEAGAVYVGPFTLPKKSGKKWIVVRSNVADEHLPSPGSRMDPSYTNVLPKLTARDKPVLTASAGAHHYRFIGIEILPDEAPGFTGRTDVENRISGSESTARIRYSNQTLVWLGDDTKEMDELPHHIIFDRCYLHGGEAGARRGISMNSAYTAVIDSWLSGFKTVGEDAQAIAGWSGAGPFKIVNNYLEGAGENILFGGGDPLIPDLVPADIEIRGNHLSKPLTWRIDDAAYAGTPWTVKNLFELKNARRVIFDGNLLEYNWHHAQTGFAVLFTVRNQNGGAPWSVVEDVTFTNNVIRHVGGGINILGHDDHHPSKQTQRIHIRNNLFYDVGGVWGGGHLIQLLDGTANVVIERNTAIHSNNIVQAGERRAHTGFVFIDNIVMHNDYGIIGGSAGVGNSSLKRYFPDAVIRRNIMVGGSADAYPDGNFFPGSISEVGFTDPARGDYRLKSAGSNKNFVTETSGVDFKALCAALVEWPKGDIGLLSAQFEDNTFEFCVMPGEKRRKQVGI